MSLRIAILCLVYCSSTVALEDGVSFIVGPGRIDCFYRTVEESGTTMDFDLQVLSGNDVSYHLRGPGGKTYVKESYIQSTNKHIELGETGSYELCFDNSYSVVSQKVVYFDLGITEPKDGRYDHLRKEENEEEGTEQLIKTMESLNRRLETVSLFQSVLKAKGSRHHRMVQDQGQKVMVFSIICCLLMMGVGTLQVFLVRKLFAEKRGVRT